MKHLNKLAIYGFLIAGCLCFSGCSDDDDRPTPSGADDDHFSVPADATDPESVLRRNFHDETGVHLLFNEKLKDIVIGVDENGDPVTKENLVDFRWNMTTYNDMIEYEGSYITDIEEQAKAADLFKKNVFPHIKGSTLAPYSILLFADLEGRVESWDDIEPMYTLSCWRCLAVNCNGWLNAVSNEEELEHTHVVCKSLVSNQFQYSSDSAKPWTDLSYEHSGEYLYDIYGDEWDQDITKVYALGYMAYKTGWKIERDYIIDTEDDFEMFMDAVFERSEDDFAAEFGIYPKIMEKYHLMKTLIEKTGYKF